MNGAYDRRGSWATRWRRIAAAPHAPVVAGALLALVAAAESITHARSTPLGYSSGHAVSTPMGQTIPHAGNGGAAVLYLMVFVLLGLATTLPITLLWTQPAAAAVVVSAACLLSLTAFRTLTVAGLGAQLVAGYRLGRTGSRPPAVLLAVPFVLLALAGTAGSEPHAASAGGNTARILIDHAGGEIRVLTLLLASLAPAAALAGIARRARGEALANTTTRQVIADTLLENTARGERARIARELHDVVAHHISMVAVQAETARLTTPGMPAAGAERLSAIGDASRAALTEMRRLLGVLREDGEAGAADRQPQPGLRLRELNELLDESRDGSRTGTRLILRGSPVTLDPGVELAAYRIVQEALTNARRHAPGAAVDVELHYADDALRLLIRDNGPGPSASASADGHGLSAAASTGGHGLSGMRERAAAVGGELRTGPAADGGFLVEARLPGKEATAG
ncbi:sensor histidine kinase [Planotetraspora sp. A-T 1434]|uniref:sensor histidine kinase n=1 Tax=Planotetraspora sp. A-T 1434 TaxID=2979219 RepID=UPI0021BE064D|nr:sensor histidine kinase [Planotetraspora sp. A-T 1434]MCT9933781.1 sensor histidine kinase [Planotetraspora sp. A-T 1434]